MMTDEEITTDTLGEVLADFISSANTELYAKSEKELENSFLWQWEEGKSAEWNTYQFILMLEMYKRTCRKWEEKHNGLCCLVEIVRKKYVMPKVREFLVELARHK